MMSFPLSVVPVNTVLLVSGTAATGVSAGSVVAGWVGSVAVFGVSVSAGVEEAA